MKTLLCEPNIKKAEGLKKELDHKGHEVDFVSNGKEAQVHLADGGYEAAVINVELSSFSAIEVIKFIKFKNIKTKIILSGRNQSVFDECLLGPEIMKKLGVGIWLVEPYPLNKLDEAIKGFFSREDWKHVEKVEKSGVEEEVQASDEKFTSIKIEEFFCGNLAIFDVYIRLKKNKYLKILKKGEAMEAERLKNYKDNKGVTHFYFKTSDRKSYVAFLNDLVKKLHKKKGVSEETKINFAENLSKLMIQEVYTRGIDKETLNETVEMCENLHKTLESATSMKSVLNDYLAYEDTVEGHLFLTMIYTDAVAQNIDWISEHSRTKLLLGALLHDIGKLKLPRNLRNKKLVELSGKSLEEYKKHCIYGVELLDQAPEIGEQIKQIVYQHHEKVNGTGFPLGLAGNKIYPLAKIVGFANDLANLSIAMGAPPYDIVKKLVIERKEIFGYDPEVVKAFIKCFIKDKK